MSISTIIWALTTAGLGSVLGGCAHYIATIPRDSVPRTPVVRFISQIAALILGSASLVFWGPRRQRADVLGSGSRLTV